MFAIFVSLFILVCFVVLGKRKLESLDKIVTVEVEPAKEEMLKKSCMCAVV